ncbi:MAG: SGNH/GDSL hydrolase family protein [Acidimicrobiia bacterium]
MRPRTRPRSAGALRVTFAAALGISAWVPTIGAASASAATGDPETSAYAPVTPCRLVDTREDPLYVRTGPVTISVVVAGRCGVPEGATAAALTFAVTGTAAPGFLTGYPAGESRPTSSVLNWGQGDVRANGSIVALANGAIDVFASSGADVVVDVTGAFVPARSATAGRFEPLDMVRALDTRISVGPLGVGGTVDVPLPGGVPLDATAVAVNVTAAGRGLPGYFTGFAAGAARPGASMLNTDAADQIRGAGTILPVSPAGLTIFASGGGHVVVDVTGWFTGGSAPLSSDGLFVPEVPVRLTDTREASGRIPAGGARVIPIDVPAAAVAVNWAIDRVGADGWLAAFPAGNPRPGVSTVNAGRSETVANFGIVPVSVAGISTISSMSADLVADRYGWFTGTPRAAPIALPRQDVAAFPAERPAPRNPDGRFTVLYVGDSMAWSTKDALSDDLAGWHFAQLTFGGSAPCDWNDGRARDLARLVAPDLVVFSFIGNNMTSCTGGAIGQALTDNYFVHLAEICDDVAPARCVAVGQPTLGPWVASSFLSVEQPTDMYRREARAGRWGFVDAGSAVESASGSYVAEYRQSDGIHFNEAGGAAFAATLATYLSALVS